MGFKVLGTGQVLVICPDDYPVIVQHRVRGPICLPLGLQQCSLWDGLGRGIMWWASICVCHCRWFGWSCSLRFCITPLPLCLGQKALSVSLTKLQCLQSSAKAVGRPRYPVRRQLLWDIPDSSNALFSLKDYSRYLILTQNLLWLYLAISEYIL